MKTSLGFEKCFIHSYLVASVNKPIIGADFLKKSGLVIDIKNMRLIDPITGTFVVGTTCNLAIPSPTFFSVESVYGKILHEFPELMSQPDFNLPVKHSIVHYINTKGTLPKSRPRRLNPEKMKAARDEFEYMNQIGMCRPSFSLCSSALHMAPTKDPNDWRPCGDYRQLNAVTIPDRYPLPHIRDLTRKLDGCTMFSKIDLIRAYYLIPVASQDVHKTAVTTPFGLFEFSRMPFGLRNAGQTFQRFMNQVTQGLGFVFVYVDDILVFSKSTAEHENHLRQLFTRLQEYGLRIKPSKCLFGVSQISFISCDISENGTKPSSGKVDSINEFPTPKTIKQLQRFIGMVNCYNRFIPNLARKLAPLYEFLTKIQREKKKPNEFSLLSNCLSSFSDVKQCLANATLLNFPRKGAKLSIASDACNTDIGAALQQWDEKGWKPLAFFSRKLSPAQSRYCTYDRELLAIKSAIKHFRQCVEGQDFIVFTDHVPLTTAINTKTEKTTRQERHLDYVAQFTTDIRDIRGSENVVACD